MKAQDLQFTQLLEGSKQFIIPIFQRTYSWEQSHCQQLWDDILRVGHSPARSSHFIGSAVYIPEDDTSAAISRWLVIDGQQRITTMTLILLAFKRRLESEGTAEPVSPELIEDYYLKNRHGKGDLQYKMLLTRADKNTLIALLDGKEPDEDASQRILENFSFFTERMVGADLNAVYLGIQKLMIVDVRLQQGIDNPQMIFESMNSTGKALTQADLIRNFVLMGLEHDLQTRLYMEYWHPMEVAFGAESYITEFDDFMRYFLVVNTGNQKIRRQDIYDEFKAYSRKHEVEDLLSSLQLYSGFYCCIALRAEKDGELSAAFHDIRELRADVCYPLLMEMYKDFQDGVLAKEDFLEIVRLVESYVFRRAVCDIATNSTGQTFATFARQLNKENYLESAKATFLLLPSYRRFPDDEEFIRQIQVRNLYKFNRRAYWLRRFENHGRKERVYVQDYTIEHIMPQNENLSAEWQHDLGENWKKVQDTYLHTLGNLTLTGYNSEYSDRPFQQKRDLKQGFAKSPLKLNEGLGSCELWDEPAIKQRAERLAETAARIWIAPDLSIDVFETYKPKVPEGTSYSLADHPHLQGGLTRELFEAFRSEILALDECVSEEFWKRYVAYKAETNFVDVVPQSIRLKLILNLDFTDVDDPRGLCKDITDIGRWGNGNVEVRLGRVEDLQYVIGLVRQALDKQLGGEN